MLAVTNDAYGISLSAFRVGVVVNFKKARKVSHIIVYKMVRR